jgi:hypothetical protein
MAVIDWELMGDRAGPYYRVGRPYNVSDYRGKHEVRKGVMFLGSLVP